MKKRRVGIALLGSAVLVALAGIVWVQVSGDPGSVRADNGEFVNPGAPLSPIANEDWYDLLSSEESEGISFEVMQDELTYKAKVERVVQGNAVEPNWVVPVEQTLSDGTAVFGYTLRYDDRIALLVTPTDLLMDPDEEVVVRDILPDVTCG